MHRRQLLVYYSNKGYMIKNNREIENSNRLLCMNTNFSKNGPPSQ